MVDFNAVNASGANRTNSSRGADGRNGCGRWGMKPASNVSGVKVVIKLFRFSQGRGERVISSHSSQVHRSQSNLSLSLSRYIRRWNWHSHSHTDAAIGVMESNWPASTGIKVCATGVAYYTVFQLQTKEMKICITATSEDILTILPSRHNCLAGDVCFSKHHLVASSSSSSKNNVEALL